jgi:hypothetical protein
MQLLQQRTLGQECAGVTMFTISADQIPPVDHVGVRVNTQHHDRGVFSMGGRVISPRRHVRRGLPSGSIAAEVPL